MADDPYVYPGTEVLRNKFNIRDPDKLKDREYATTTAQAANAPIFPLTAEGYKATHQHLFGRVFNWAGEVRTVEIAKPGTRFPPAQFVEAGLRDRFRQVDLIGGFKGMDGPHFAAEAAHHISELNALHPFREGNGRTMRLHLEQIAEVAGHDLDINSIDPQAWIDASITAFHASETPLALIIGKAIGLEGNDLAKVRDAVENGHER